MSLTSIIITTQSRPQLLRRAVESARSAGTSVEIVVVDDASDDETSSVCRSLSGIKYVRVERRQGVAGARNLGIVASRGEYITFLDDDDRRVPGSIDRQLELLERDEQAGMIYGQAICLDQRGEITDQIYPRVCPQGDLFWDLLGRNFIPCGSAIFRRSCLERVGLLDDSVPGLDDWDLWIRIAELCAIISRPEPVMHWRRSTPVSGQGTSEAASIVSRSVRQYRECWLKLPRAAESSPAFRRAAWENFSANMAAHLCWETLRSLRHRNFSQAAKNLIALPRLGPLIPVRLARKYRTAHRLRQVTKTARATAPALKSGLGNESFTAGQSLKRG